MKVHDRIYQFRVWLLLQLHPLFQRAYIVAEMRYAGRLNSREDDSRSYGSDALHLCAACNGKLEAPASLCFQCLELETPMAAPRVTKVLNVSKYINARVQPERKTFTATVISVCDVSGLVSNSMG